MPFLKICDKQLEYVWHGPSPADAPTLVFLHEGLGCIAMWRDLPERLATQTGYGVLVFSRAGYGNSDPIELPREVGFMHDEALITLPQILDTLDVREAILVGHSDGGSISIIYAGGTGDPRLRGLILEAPHVFVEEYAFESTRNIAEDYRGGSLKSRLERYHGKNVDATFWGWNDFWLNPESRSWNIEEYVRQIHVPVLLIQGEDDQYGTLDQMKAIESGCQRSVRLVVLRDCGHSPHIDQPERSLEVMKAFVAELEIEAPTHPPQSR